MERDIEKIVDFLEAVRPFQLTERFPKKPNGVHENDAEHSWALAMAIIALEPQLKNVFGEDLNIELMLKMALVHDLGEIDPGDVPTWDKIDETDVKLAEEECVERLCILLPDEQALSIRSIWEECETKSSLEAKIVKSLDRIDPVIHRVAFSQGWGEGEHATLEAIDERQLERHSFSDLMVVLYEVVRKRVIQKSLLER